MYRYENQYSLAHLKCEGGCCGLTAGDAHGRPRPPPLSPQEANEGDDKGAPFTG